MLKWMSGKLLVANFHRDFRFATEALSNDELRELCSFLLHRIHSVKTAARVSRDAEFSVTTQLLSSLHLPTGWLSRLQRENVAEALLEHWLTAKQASLTGQIDETQFRLIDHEIRDFARGRLKASEIEGINMQIGFATAPISPSESSTMIDDLIVEYAAMAKSAQQPNTQV